jgi:hypothetical protein
MWAYFDFFCHLQVEVCVAIRPRMGQVCLGLAKPFELFLISAFRNLQVEMCDDVPGKGFFRSGLAAFASRTAYANSSGDHLVRRLCLSIQPAP